MADSNAELSRIGPAALDKRIPLFDGGEEAS